MIYGNRVLAVIPARGGSKRAPRKNILPFRGKPLFLWSVIAADNSRYIDATVLSTEDREIAQLAKYYAVPVLDRPSELGGDTASNEDVLRHALSVFPGYGWIVLLQPTSPLRTTEDIDACLNMAQLTATCISYRPDGTKNGAVYVANVEWIAKHDFSEPTARYTMPFERSLDIDHLEDFHGFAESELPHQRTEVRRNAA